MFNVADFVGRFITHWVSVSQHTHTHTHNHTQSHVGTHTHTHTHTHTQLGSHMVVLFVCASLRVVFVPLIMLCKFSGNEDPVMNSDVYPVLFVSLLGLTNGYLGSMAMISAPQ